MCEKQETFNYTYTAKQQEEIQQIREKYLPKEETKMERLRRLDESAEKPGRIAALGIGSLGALLLGIGMCCTMVWTEAMFEPGILIGIAGIAGISAAYPLFIHITKRQRKKLAPEILRLTDEM